MIYYQHTVEDSDHIPMAESSCACHVSLQGLKINVNTVEEIAEHSDHLYQIFHWLSCFTMAMGF